MVKNLFNQYENHRESYKSKEAIEKSPNVLKNASNVLFFFWMFYFFEEMFYFLNFRIEQKQKNITTLYNPKKINTTNTSI